MGFDVFPKNSQCKIKVCIVGVYTYINNERATLELLSENKLNNYRTTERFSMHGPSWTFLLFATH